MPFVVFCCFFLSNPLSKSELVRPRSSMRGRPANKEENKKHKRTKGKNESPIKERVQNKKNNRWKHKQMQSIDCDGAVV